MPFRRTLCQRALCNYLTFIDYKEIAIQFGFATMFSSAFPLAPVFALINNVIEIRLDAQKYTNQTKRPIPCRSRGIGIWYSIFRFIAILSVITNVSYN